MTASSAASASGVAIIGIGCRFPGGVVDPVSFWRLLRDGRDVIGEIPPSRFDLKHYYDSRPATPGRVMTRWGGFLEGIEQFDPLFFGISPREAERLDPQQRLLLETAVEALEDAGENMMALQGSATGVFVGQWLNDFEGRLFADPEAVDFYMTTGSGRYASSGRVSYQLGFHGPSLTIDTACSSSLVAVHLAARSIRSGESTLALAGGVNIILQPHVSIAYSQSRMLAADGRCKFGDASGDGYVRSEGAGLVVLKALDRAIADGDRIYAVIRGSAINNDGRTSGSMGTPSRVGQEKLLRQALRDAGVTPGSVGYIEAHGTGTRAGDPVELGALSDVLGEGRGAGPRARVGSVKTNFGHTEGAAGVAGLIKVALSLHHQTIPPSLHCKELNSAVPWGEVPVEIARTLQPWEVAGEASRVGGVSGFGIAGSNAHIVLEEAPGRAGSPPPVDARTTPQADAQAHGAQSLRGEARAQVLVLSARSPEALAALAGRYADVLSAADAPSLHDLCASAALHRAPMEYRAAFSTESAQDLLERLRRFAAGESQAAQAVGQASEPRARRIAFVFPGQGSQYIGMARELLLREPVFADAIDRCAAAMRPFVDWSLREQLAANEGTPAFRMDDISVIQPVLLAVEIALAELWRFYGVEPAAVVGHSMGEAGAAYFAGALTLDDAMAVICRRSALMRSTSGRGAMAVVDLSFDDLARRLESYGGRVSVAVSNAPGSSVMSGDPAAVTELLAQFEKEGIFARQVKVDVASHSPQMDPLVPKLVDSLSHVRAMPTRIDLYSTVDGRKADGAGLDNRYWGRNLRSPVRFGKTIEAMLLDGIDTFIEVSPHGLLLSPISQVSAAVDRASVALNSGRRNEPEQVTLLASLGALFVAGHPVDWRRQFGSGFRRVELPKYPWQRERYWLAEVDRAGRARVVRQSNGDDSLHPLLGGAMDLASDDMRCWECSLDTGRVGFAAAHSLHGAPVFGASAFLELMLAAGRACSGADSLDVSNVRFERALYLEPSQRTTLQVRATVAPQGARLVEVFARHADQWRRHASGYVQALRERAAAWRGGAGAAAAPGASLGERGVDAAFYQALENVGVRYAAELRSVQRLERAGDHWLAQVVAAETPGAEACLVAPSILDGFFQIAVATAPEFRDSGSLVMPRSLERLRFRSGTARQLTIDVERDTGVTLKGRDDAGRVCLEMQGLRLQQAGDAASPDPEKWLHAIEWEATDAGDAANSVLSAIGGSNVLLVTGNGAESHALAAAVTAALRQLSAEASTVEAGNVLDAALERARQSGTWNAVVCFGSLDAPQNDQLTDAALAREPIPGGAAVLAASRSLDRAEWKGSPKLWIVTRGAQAIDAAGRSDVSVAQGAMWGLSRSMAVEHADQLAGVVDLDPRGSVESQALALLSEFATNTFSGGGANPAGASAGVGGATAVGRRSGAGHDACVAYRAGRRYVAQLASVDASSTSTQHAHAAATFVTQGGEAASTSLAAQRGEAASTSFAVQSGPAATFSSHGAPVGSSTLITGGLGGVGLHVARWLIAQGARRLLITGRSTVPPRAEWAALTESHPAFERVKQLRALENAGAEVHYRSVDLANRQQISDLLQTWQNEGRPPVRAVFHAAGVIDDKLLAQVDSASIANVFGAKARAAWALHELLGDVDRFVMFSSVASILASPGQGSYAAANAFLDSLAHHRRANGQHALSVSWGVWADTGFGASQGGKQAREHLEQGGLRAFEPADALVALGHALASSAPHVAVLRADWSRVAAAANGVSPPPLLKRLVASAAPAAQPAVAANEPSFLDELRDAPRAKWNALLEERVVRHASSILKLPATRIDVRKPLGSFGLDSIMALELRKRLERDLLLALPATLIWNYPTAVAIGTALVARLEPVAGDQTNIAGAASAGAAIAGFESAGAAAGGPGSAPGSSVPGGTASAEAATSSAAANARSDLDALSDAEALAALRGRRGRRS
jgi:myxalamid-type polyketide synthase MxaE and MxaD